MPIPRPDVVVVGAGAAGCVVAARLAEHPAREVLLLEAGPDLRADPPVGMHAGSAMFRDHSWGYQSVPDDRGVVSPLHRGRLVGGTAWVTRFAVRGSPLDFDRWAARGNAGWSFDQVLPYFCRLETDLDHGQQPWHGSNGPIPITRYPDQQPSPFELAARDAFVQNGFQLVEDHNQPYATGFGRMPRNARRWSRVTTADGYLPMGGTPPNLVLRVDSPVGWLLVEGDSVVGVRLVDGTAVEAGHVVLCAGTYGSPALLQRSGIGPAELLQGLGLRIHAARQGVGENLADHPVTDIHLAFRGAAVTEKIIHSIATFRTMTTGADEPPDVALWVAEPEGDPVEAFVDVLLMTPLSRGRVRIASVDPTEPPVIQLPGLQHDADVDRLCEAYRRAHEVASSPALRAVGAGELPALGDDAELRAAVRAGSSSTPHTVGTCAMGPAADEGAVVDADGSVHGMEGLSVVDASVIPVALSGFPHVVTIMLAEKLSERLAARL